jgi:transcriptional regulator with XRE-family HTH domain
MAQADRPPSRREPNGPAYVALRTELVAARTSAGLTQQAVADRMGRPQSLVAKIEGGERTIDFVELVAMAKIIGLDIGGLMKRIEPLI